MKDLEVENQSKIRFISKQKLAKYIDSKNTLKTLLACSEAEIINFFCFGHMPFLTTQNTKSHLSRPLG
jgi:hypothetical protein